MELNQIRHFVAVTQAGSFTAAAELCGVSQPGLTKSIRALERELGGSLFHREGNRTLVTDLGRVMAPLFSQMVEQAQLARRTAESFQVLKTSSLRVGVMSTIGGAKLAPWVAEFRVRHPGIDLELHQGTGDDITSRLDRGELQLAVMNAALHGHRRHRAEPLYREAYVVAFGPGHPFQSLERVCLTDLEAQPFVDRLSCELRKQFQVLCRDRQVSLVPVARTDREDWTQELLVAGLGCAVLPEFSVNHSHIRTRPLVEPEVSREISLICMRGRQLSNAARTFRGALRTCAPLGPPRRPPLATENDQPVTTPMSPRSRPAHSPPQR
jgi:DNA-binding transcriptional LysR family regulator